MIVKREHFLEVHLHDFLATRENSPFEWGHNDCALFAADAIEACTGTDIAEVFRGKYDSESSALATIREVTGGTTVADAAAYCAENFGLAEYQYPLLAKRGDLVIVTNRDGRDIAGIVDLSGRHVASPGEEGLVRFPITDVKRAWNLSDTHEWTDPKGKQRAMVDAEPRELQAPANQRLLQSP